MLYPYCIWKETLMSTMEGDAENFTRPPSLDKQGTGIKRELILQSRVTDIESRTTCAQ